jgi:hypothetical protein
MGYLCWPYLDDPAAPSAFKTSAKLVDVNAALLSPPAAPPLVRDPFAPAAALASQSAHPSAVKARSGTPLSAPDRPAAPGKSAPAPAFVAPSALVLKATLVRGNHRLAVINDSLYGEGDPIRLPESTAPVCAVARVTVDNVVLELNGETAELTFPAMNPTRPGALQQALPAPHASTGSTSSDHAAASEGPGNEVSAKTVTSDRASDTANAPPATSHTTNKTK